MNPEVIRLLNYMASFGAQSSGVAEVAVLMDKIANAPSVGEAVVANRSGKYDVPYATAQLALEAVEYAINGGPVPEWLKQAGAVE